MRSRSKNSLDKEQPVTEAALFDLVRHPWCAEYGAGAWGKTELDKIAPYIQETYLSQGDWHMRTNNHRTRPNPRVPGAQRRDRGRLAGRTRMGLGKHHHLHQVLWSSGMKSWQFIIFWGHRPFWEADETSSSFPQWTDPNTCVYNHLDFLKTICTPSRESLYPKLRPLA